MTKTVLKFLEKAKINGSSRKETLGTSIKNIEYFEKNQKKLELDFNDKYIIVGVPDDRGVIENNGNPGAKEGPDRFRESFYRLYDTNLRIFNPSTHKPFTSSEVINKNCDLISSKFFDAGNLVLSKSIEETHERLSEVVNYFIKKNAKMIFVIGGGHDFSYGSYKGHVLGKQKEKIPIINLDAHFDLRPVENGKINSGTAFRRIIEDFPFNIHDGKALLEIGIQRERNPQSLYDYVFEKKIPTIEYMTLLNVWRDLFAGHAQTPLEHIRDHLDDCTTFGFDRFKGSVHISLCLDIFDQAIAPGTSASTPFGVQVKDLSQSLTFIAKSQTCRVMDIAELCPARDTHEMTSRLTAALVYRMALLREEYSSRLT
ncbi:formimidoylglutamase [Pigmentibacter sp. JX0631]|uniref:formimidoylglutamase n=1 Tax=Pigmentibacter sp. JX0631 TaxID=2976982 RepID=UPI0024687828|nr:formimidoylglutamase [Pigmentibacter sp. JX0631]WGL61194.1 formimidoylglutamase [Pigmentibacter sp. JX0631]